MKASDQSGRGVLLYNEPEERLKKLELIIAGITAGNTSIKMRNTGVTILDTLLKTSAINRSQYKKIHNQYFKV